MKRKEQYILEDLIKDSDNILDDIDLEEINKYLENNKDDEVMQREICVQEIDSLDSEENPNKDGYVDIRVSNDEMTVTADFYPVIEGGKPIGEFSIQEELLSQGVISGIDWELIKDKIHTCNNERIQINNVIIARGEKPINEVPEHIQIEDNLLQKLKEKTRKEDNTLSLDYKDRTFYTLVKKGQIIARIIPLQEGKNGKTVKGEVLPYKTTRVATIESSENTELQDDKIIATRDGRFEFINNLIFVKEIFEIFGDVDYHTGNISFPGDIIIHGQVKDGFKIVAGGSIYCKGALDASEVICENDLFVSRGIIGRKKGRVEVNGSIKTKYIENCHVRSKDSIHVQTGILHSIIHTKNKLEMGIKSIIAGGKIHAQNGIIAYHIGTKMGIKTEIRCGIDSSVQNKVEWIKDKKIALAMKIKQIDDRIKKRPSEKENLLITREKLDNAINKLNTLVKSLICQIDKNEEANIIVKGVIYPGSYLEICHISYIVSREMENVRFWLDKNNGKINVEAYNPELSFYSNN
jgi:uncharacterized protein (DUF342 family)